MRLGLCVLGCGSFARVFAQAVSGSVGEIDLFFASRDPARAREYASRFNGVDAFGGYASAVSDPRVDAIYVCTPHHLHREHVALAAGHGKHVLVEKPIAGTMADAEAMVEQAASAGVNLMVAENYRFLPPVQEAKNLVDQGLLGQIRLVQFQEQYPFRPSGWRNRRELNGGGVLIDGGIHKFSALTHLSGRPKQIFAQKLLPGQPRLDAEDGVVVVTRTDDGIVGLINHSWSVAPPTPHSWFAVSGAAGYLYSEPGRPWLRLLVGDNETILDLEADSNGVAPMVREFHRSIVENREPTMTGNEGIADLALVLKAYESIDTGLPASLP